MCLRLTVSRNFEAMATTDARTNPATPNPSVTAADGMISVRMSAVMKTDFSVRRHVQQPSEEPVRRPTNRRDQHKRESQRAGIIWRKLEKPEAEGDEQESDEIIECQSVHRDAIEHGVDERVHHVAYLSKPLVLVATPAASIA